MDLNQKQRKRIADILTNAGNITLAAAVIVPLFQKGEIRIVPVLGGVLFSIVLYAAAVLFEQEE